MAIILKAATRVSKKKSVLGEIRDAGRIPGVVYGDDQAPRLISVDNLELLKTLRDEGRNAIISLDIENGETTNVILHDYQVDPLKGTLVHLDFFVVNMKEEMDVEVPVRIDGEAAGVKEGGVLQQPLFELQVRAKPNNIPDEIAVDVSALEIGESISVADIKVSDAYEILDEEDATVVVISAPEAEVEPTDPSEVNVEPELVGADKEDEA